MAACRAMAAGPWVADQGADQGHALVRRAVRGTGIGGSQIRPPLTVSTIPSRRPGMGRYTAHFTGKYAHRTLPVGHNVPREAPHAFAQAVIDVDHL